MSRPLSIEHLPPEVLVTIFQQLNNRDLRNVENVCTKWHRLVTLYFWRIHIQYLAKNNPKLTQHLRDSFNWSEDCKDFALTQQVWQKINCSERWERDPDHVEALLYQYAPANSRMKVSTCVMFKDKLFVSMIGGNVHSRSLTNLQLSNELHSNPLTYRDDEPVMLTMPMALYSNILAVPVGPERVMKIWHAETEELLYDLDLPNGTSKIYDVRINATHIVCLASWKIIAWRYRMVGDAFKAVAGPTVTSDSYDLPGFMNSANIWFETHNIEMNERFVITHASQPLLSVFRQPSGPKTRSFLHCRQLQDDQMLLKPRIKLNDEAVFHMEIGGICLSSVKYNLLAISMVDENMCFRYAVKLMCIPSGQILTNIFQTSRLLNSEVRMPITWVDNKLFMKLAPKANDIDSVDTAYDQDVTLSLWNYETNEELFLDHVIMTSIGDHIMVDHANVVQLSHRFTRIVNCEQEQNLQNEILGHVYDYWTN